MKLLILLIEDSPDDAFLVNTTLEAAGYMVESLRVEDEPGLRRALSEDLHFDVVLTDYKLPRFDAIGALRVLRELRPDLPVIVVSGAVGEETAAATMSAGASDFVLKDNLGRLPSRVAHRVAEAQTSRARGLAQLAVRETEDRFRVMADCAPVAIWVTGPEGRCAFVNRGWLAFTGRSFAEEIDGGWYAVCHPEDLGRVRASYVAAFAGRVEFRTEFRARRFDGEWRWLSSRGVPRCLADGEFQGYIGSCIDVTDFKRAAEEREEILAREREAKAEAERQGHLKDEFLATLSHELRTPMAAITGWIEMLQRGALPPREQVKALAAIDRNARAQLKLITDLFDISRAITGKLALDMGTVDLLSLVRTGIDSVRLSADAKGIDIALVDFGECLKVSGDASRLQQVVWNLLSNAIKFTPRCGRVTVSAGCEGSCAVVRVVDNGEGVDPTFLPRVFERFSQADRSTTRLQGGLGLGLSIVRHLVEMHGGSVFASSDGRGLGATFGFRLPVLAVEAPTFGDPPDQEEDPFSVQARHDASSRKSLAGRRIVVVDDNEDAVVLLATLLSFHGAEVIETSCAQEAFEAIVAREPDLLLSDIGMPGEDGFSLIRRIRRFGAIARGAGGSASEGIDVSATLGSAMRRSAGGSECGDDSGRRTVAVATLTTEGLAIENPVAVVDASIVPFEVRVARLPAIALSAHAHIACREEALDAGFHACLTKPVDAAKLVEAIVLALLAEQV